MNFSALSFLWEFKIPKVYYIFKILLFKKHIVSRKAFISKVSTPSKSPKKPRMSLFWYIV